MISAFGLSEQIESIESKEQQLIQHIRTSGLKVSRESFLIEEVSELRRLRRSMFSEINNKIKESYKNTQIEKDKIIEDYERKLQKCSSDLEGTIQSQRDEIEATVKKCKSQIEMFELKSSMAEKKNALASANQAKLQAKLFSLEKRLSDIQSLRQKDKQNAESNFISNEEHDKKIKDILCTFEEKIDRYKTAIRRVAEKEKNLVDELDTKNIEIRKMNELLKEYQEKSEQGKSYEKLFKELSSKFEKLKQAYLQQKQTYEKNIQDTIVKHQSEIHTLQQEHSEELNSIDDRIRQLLDAKERQVEGLLSELDSATQRYRDAESILMNLQAEVTSRDYDFR